MKIWWILHQGLPFDASFCQNFIVICHNNVICGIIKITITLESIFIDVTIPEEIKISINLWEIYYARQFQIKAIQLMWDFFFRNENIYKQNV